MLSTSILNKLQPILQLSLNERIDVYQFLRQSILKDIPLKANSEVDEQLLDGQLTEEIKEILDKSILYHHKNEEKALPADTFLNSIAQKYNYEL